MPQNAQFFLLANIDHFTTLLQDHRLDARQEVAVRLLLAESWHRLSAMEPSGAQPGDQSPPLPISPLTAVGHSWPVVVQPDA
jgi:hypothetical protein